MSDLQKCLEQLEVLRINNDAELDAYKFIRTFLTGIKNNSKQQCLFSDLELARISNYMCEASTHTWIKDRIDAYFKQKQG